MRVAGSGNNAGFPVGIKLNTVIQGELQMRVPRFLTIAAFAAVSSFAFSQTLASGTEIKVRTDTAINAQSAAAGQSYAATVSQDVKDSSGNVVIPSGARARLATVATGDNQISLALSSISANGQRYYLNTNCTQAESTTAKEGVGKNKRTAKYV